MIVSMISTIDYRNTRSLKLLRKDHDDILLKKNAGGGI